MARILRGDVLWADLETTRGREQSGRRPVLVISHEVFNAHSETVIALAITSQPQRAGYPLTWALPSGRLPRPSWVKISQVRTLSAGRLGRRIARLEDELFGHRMKRYTNQLHNTMKIRQARREIARTKTVLAARGRGADAPTAKSAAKDEE